MEIRRYRPEDCREITALFYQTVHTVNAKDYTEQQLNAWAKEEPDPQVWNLSFLEHDSFVVVEDGRIAGFGDIDRTGYLDRLYVHASYQGRGIGTALCERLEQTAAGDITVHASVTALGFFEKRGYRVIREQQVERQGIFLTNFVMEKKAGL